MQRNARFRCSQILAATESRKRWVSDELVRSHREFYNLRLSDKTASAAGHGGPRSRSNKAAATQFESRHHLSKLQAVVVENSLDVTRVVMEYLTKKLPNLVVAMPK
jgi:hypothetical protein